MNLQGKELEQFLQASADGFQSDIAFLTQRGWVEVEKKEIDGEKVFSVWISPIDGKEYSHQNSMFGTDAPSAIERAHQDLIREQGWKEFGVTVYQPELAQFRDGDENPHEWWMAIHPQSNRVYSYMEAVEISRYNDGKDMDENCLCGKTRELQAIINENSIKPEEDMTLEVDFVLEDRDTHFHRFRSVECKDEAS